MEKFVNMGYNERAQLLHSLFPDEMPKLVSFMEGMAAAVLQQEESNRQQWTNTSLKFDEWLVLVQEAEAKIKRYGERLHRENRLFSDQLFGGLLCMFSIHCLNVYCTTIRQPNAKFQQAVQLLFL